MKRVSLLAGAVVLLGSIGFACAQSGGDVPIIKVTPVSSTITFGVAASIPIQGKFKTWNATLVFGSREVTSAALHIKIDAASVDTGSGMKNNTLKGNDFFDVKDHPYITFDSTKVVQTGPTTFELDGNFSIRGVTKDEKIAFDLNGKGTGHGTLKGTMAFDRKDYGMNSGIPFIKIADRVEVNVDLTADRVGGPPPIYKQ